MSTEGPAPKRQKRSYDDMNTAPPLFTVFPPRVFGKNLTFPFRFNKPAPTLLTQGAGSAFGRREPVARERNAPIHYHMYPAPAPQADIPSVLFGFLKLLFYLALAVVFICILLLLIHTFWGDLERRISGYRLDVVQDITMCEKNYRANLCVVNPIPAMALQCATWETCMNQDPTIVGRLKVGAELIAEMVNSFVEPITGKTAASVLALLLALVVFKKLIS